MKLQFYNSLTRKKEVFKPIKKIHVSLYTCGPTVYSYAHIGNLRTYIFEDVLKRTLFCNKYKVKHVMNITDVGHLTSDADTGEDKMELAAQKEKKSAWNIAAFYTKSFKEDIKKLNILPPTTWCKATDHIKEQIDWIKKLEKAGYTYKTSDGIYFNTSKFKDYGKLALLEKQQQQAGKRIAVGEKKNSTDFALWKFSPENEKRQMEWSSPWSERGFPGWHIECSAMSTKYLGNHFDIHCGGIDHIPIHHTNEIAQTEAITKKKWVNYWLHGEFLLLEEKMSKSKGNIITLSTVEERGFSPLDYRYFCLNSHYRKQLAFSWEALTAAKNARERIKEKVREIKKSRQKGNAKTTKKYKEQFISAINDDLNTPEALAVLWSVIKDSSLSKKDMLALLKTFDNVLALDITKEDKITIPKEVLALAKQRQKYREQKDFANADKARKEIESKGYIIEDQGEGFRIKRG